MEDKCDPMALTECMDLQREWKGREGGVRGQCQAERERERERDFVLFLLQLETMLQLVHDPPGKHGGVITRGEPS